ncbi:MAG: DJ-1/PfpI family protein [Bacteroidales bacterium]|nr:DJ-1/PfpI family protein [Bacteroidales bacterium]
MKKNKNILLPIPSYGFDPTEVAIPWKILSENGFQIIFATPEGKKAEGDRLMLTGDKLGVFKSLLKARKDAVSAYDLMLKSKEFNNPIKYSEINEDEFYSIYLPGGHDKGVKEYLESPVLQRIIPLFFENNKKVGAICHGVILLARCINKETLKSVIYEYRTTSLLKSQELLAYKLTKLWLKDYYLTYPEITVEDEVISSLKSKSQFIYGSKPVFRDTLNNTKHGFFVRDKNYISARWPGDIYSFVFSYIKLLNEE